ncbi:hypothetical protein [Geminocystis sp. CENA526]|uniref:hypothetical protein n=1 Tax=Geminocystis sp. CENA526 TaxID=1355871 RepID=UPI003D6FAFC7
MIEPLPSVIARHEAISKLDRTSLSCHCEVTKQSPNSIELPYPVIARHEAIPKPRSHPRIIY